MANTRSVNDEKGIYFAGDSAWGQLAGIVSALRHQRALWLQVAQSLSREGVNLEIILRDFLVDILRGRAKNSRCLSWLRLPSPRAKERFQLLRAHLEDGRSFAAIAREAKISYRTLQYWLERYRTSGLAALARKPRIDPGRRRKFSAPLQEAIEGPGS